MQLSGERYVLAAVFQERFNISVRYVSLDGRYVRHAVYAISVPMKQVVHHIVEREIDKRAEA